MKLLDSFLAPLVWSFPGFVWLKLHSEVILILTSDTFTSKNVILYINCLKKNKEYSGFKEITFLAIFPPLWCSEPQSTSECQARDDIDILAFIIHVEIIPNKIAMG